MVRGLDLFRQWFAEYPDQFVLIGGIAAGLTMARARLAFRATRDLDVVLHVEAITPAFVTAVRAFVAAGGYRIREAADPPKAALYRFQRPSDPRFPPMIELFCRRPATLEALEGQRYLRIPPDEVRASLSAILLDPTYYDFIVSGRTFIDGLPLIVEDRLIPLKANAWLDLRARHARGERIDSRSIRKHANDILRLSRLLAPGTRIDLPGAIAADLQRCLHGMCADATLDPVPLGIRGSLSDAIDRLAQAFRIDMSTGGG